MENLTWIFFWIVMLIGLGCIIAWYYFTRINPLKDRMRGRDHGRQKAVSAARRFALSNAFRFISPATLGGDKATAELDAVIIGYFGILGVKALGYNGEVYGGEKEKTWAQVVGGKRVAFPNPVTEAAADVRVIRDALFAAKLKQIPVEVVCVFTDRKAQLAIQKASGCYTMKGFKELLDKEKYLEDCGLDLDKTQNALEAGLVPGPEQP